MAAEIAFRARLDFFTSSTVPYFPVLYFPAKRVRTRDDGEVVSVLRALIYKSSTVVYHATGGIPT